MPFTFDPKRYPASPGCYLMRDAAGKVIYVGKAKSLRHRLAFYFRESTANGKAKQRDRRYANRIRRLVKEVDAVDVILVSTELESLVLENNLIKRHHPRYNRMLMPERSGYHYIALTGEALPRLLPYRKQRLNKVLDGVDMAERIGPYLTYECRDALLTYVNDHFGLRTCQPMPARVCLRYHLHACSGVCEKHIDAATYSETVRRARDFLARPHDELLADMRTEMLACAERLEFERAQRIKEQIQALEMTLQAQSVERDIGHDQDYVYFGGDVARQAVTAIVRKGLLLEVQLAALDGALAYPDSCNAYLQARYRTSAPPEVITNAPGEVLGALDGRRTQLRRPASEAELALLEICRINYTYRVTLAS